jgi:hypothetical protein
MPSDCASRSDAWRSCRPCFIAELSKAERGKHPSKRGNPRYAGSCSSCIRSAHQSMERSLTGILAMHLGCRSAKRWMICNVVSRQVIKSSSTTKISSSSGLRGRPPAFRLALRRQGRIRSRVAPIPAADGGRDAANAASDHQQDDSRHTLGLKAMFNDDVHDRRRTGRYGLKSR